jgi:hypothetical protein
VNVAPGAGHDGIGDGDGGNVIRWIGTGSAGAEDPPGSAVAAERAASASVGDGSGGGSKERWRRRSRIPASCWLRLRTAAVNCLGVRTMSPAVVDDPWGSVTAGEVEATIAKVADGVEVVGGGGREEEGTVVVPGGPDITDTRLIGPGILPGRLRSA